MKSTNATRSGSVGPPIEPKSRGSDPKRLIPAKKATLLQPACGDLLSCSPTLFDGNQPGSFSGNHPERCYGVVIKTVDKGRLLTVDWSLSDGSGEDISDILSTDVKVEKKKMKAPAILAVMLVEGEASRVKTADKDDWSRDFFEALVKVDWRKWVEAVKKEIGS